MIYLVDVYCQLSSGHVIALSHKTVVFTDGMLVSDNSQRNLRHHNKQHRNGIVTKLCSGHI